MDRKSMGLLPALGTIVGFSIKYSAYGALLFSVLIAMAMLIVIDIGFFGGDVSFLRNLSFLLPLDQRGNGELVTGDFLRLYSLVTLAMLVISMAVRGLVWFVRQQFAPKGTPGAEAAESAQPENPLIRQLKRSGRRLLINIVVIAAIFAGAFLAVPRMQMAPGESHAGMYVIFAIFFVIACVAQLIYVFTSGLGEFVLGWSLPRLGEQIAAYTQQEEQSGGDRAF